MRLNVHFIFQFQNMFNVTAMRMLLKEAKKKSLDLHSSNVKHSRDLNNTLQHDDISSRSKKKFDSSLFRSVNASLQKDIALLLSISDLDAHSLWLKTAHDRKKLIKEVWIIDLNLLPTKWYSIIAKSIFNCTKFYSYCFSAGLDEMSHAMGEDSGQLHLPALVYAIHML